MDIKARIRQRLNEMNLDQLYGDMKRVKAKTLGLTHAAYDNYVDRYGNKFVWDKSSHSFRMSEPAPAATPKAAPSPAPETKVANTEVPADKSDAAQNRPNTPNNLVKSIQDVEDFEIEEIENKKGMGWDASILKSNNWGLVADRSYHSTSFRIYGDIENVGRKGKTVRENRLSMDIFQSRYVWKNSIVNRIKKVKPKTYEDVIALIKSEFKRAEQAEKESDPTKEVRVHEREDVLKGVDRDIPDFGLEGDFKSEVGEDVGIHFDKPEINISSKSNSERLDQMRMTSYTKIKWTQRKKVAAIKDKLLKAKDLEQALNILRDAGIKYEYRSYMQGGFD